MTHRLKKFVSLSKVIGLLMIFIGSEAYAATEIPHTFGAGSVARANEVNENFNALANAIDAISPALRGPVGPRGDLGLIGPRGETGPAGTSGDRGSIGPRGETGATGSSGDRGPIGPRGETGPTGAKGRDGTEILPNEVRDRFFSGSSCKGNDTIDLMEKVGPLCVDKYEASVWDETGTVQYDGMEGSSPYPCGHNGNDCSKPSTAIYARSVANVLPARLITWFQAQQACAMSGKRLLTNAEWQMAAAGTPDPGTDNGVDDCVVESFFSSETGSRSKCVSNWKVHDMVGNLNEWVADWVQGNGLNGTSWAPSSFTSVTDAEYGSDHMVGANQARIQGSASPFLAALYRGGSWNSKTKAGVFALHVDFGPDRLSNVGFRCAR